MPIYVYIRDGYSVDLSGTSLPSSPQPVATESQLDYQMALERFFFKYAYRQGEIIPASRFGSLSYIPYRTQGTVGYVPQYIESEINIYTKVSVYTINQNGEIKKFTADSATPASPEKSGQALHIIRADSLYNGEECITDDDGYVVGIEIFPILVKRPEHLTHLSGDETCFALSFVYGGDDGYTLKSLPDAPIVEALEGADAFRIVQPDTSLSYEYSIDMTEWKPVENTDRTAMTRASTEYFVRVAEDENNAPGKPSGICSVPIVTSSVTLSLGGNSAIVIALDGVEESGVHSVKFYDQNGIELNETQLFWNDGFSAVSLKVPQKDYADVTFKYAYSFVNDNGDVTEVLHTTESIAHYLEGLSQDDRTKAFHTVLCLASLYFDSSKTASDIDATLIEGLEKTKLHLLSDNSIAPPSRFNTQYSLTLNNEKTSHSSVITYSVCNYIKNMVENKENAKVYCFSLELYRLYLTFNV